MTQNKSRLFGRHSETVQHLTIFFFRIVIFYVPYIYGANFIARFRWESGFLGVGGAAFHGTPLGHEREFKYLGHLSVKAYGLNFVCECLQILKGLEFMRVLVKTSLRHSQPI